MEALGARHGVLLSLISAAAVSLVGGLVSIAARTQLLHDLFGSLAFITAIFTSLARIDNDAQNDTTVEKPSSWAASWRPSRQIIVSCMVILWAVRLGAYLCYRSFKYGQDSRGRGGTGLQRPFKYLLLWLLQALLWVCPTVLPAVLLNQVPSPARLTMPHAPAFMPGSPWHNVVAHVRMMQQAVAQALMHLASSGSSSEFWSKLLLLLPKRLIGIAADPVSLHQPLAAGGVPGAPLDAASSSAYGTAPAVMAAWLLVFWAACDALGLLLYAAGSVMEVAADLQKLAFKMDSRNKGSFITTGLWRYSRHPNYFGEMLLWWGIYLVCLPGLLHASPGKALLALLGPVSVVLLLRFVSGVPPLEADAARRWGQLPEWQQHCRDTNLLVPWPKRRFARRVAA